MTLELACPKCGETCQADTEEELMSIAGEHVEDQHPEMELDDDTVEELKSQAKEI